MVDDIVYYVYQIKNTVTNTTYIGVTKDIEGRFKSHRRKSSNKYLRYAIDVFGIENFEFSIIEETSIELISEVEKQYIQSARQSGQALYNISNGGLIGNDCPAEDHWNHKLTSQDVISIRELYSSNKITQRALSELYGISNKQISKILRGERWTSTGGPITLNSLKNKVANRRKLTDEEVVRTRQEAKEEYIATGTLSIVDIANIFRVAPNSMRSLLLGKTYQNLDGPILRRDYFYDFGKKNDV